MFFCANAYFQIKSNKEFTKPKSDEFSQLEKLETEGYESAKKLRREILQEVRLFLTILALLIILEY
jgi:E3 ubiquitin-protein ligase SHPRH